MRGGTSKAVFLREADLPAPGPERDQLILRIFGSPDRRQIDGLGGADPLTSKLAIIGTHAGYDLTYTFAQVAIDRPQVDYHSLCGNISAAVGLYAVQEGLAPAVSPVSRVRAWSTNLGCELRIDVPVQDGEPVTEGDFAVPGVPGTGARIELDLADTQGRATGRLLPTGNPVDRLDVPGVGAIDASLVDVGNAHVFVRAPDVGLTGAEAPEQLDADRELLARLERIRAAGASRMGMAESSATPIIGVISASAGSEADVVSRLLFMQVAHKTYAGTSTVCTGVAARLQESIVAEALRPAARERPWVRIAHPAGVIETESRVEANGDGAPVVRRATLGRTARRILDGVVYV